MPGRDRTGGGTPTRQGGWLSGLALLGVLLVARAVVRSARRWLHDGRSRRQTRVDQRAVQAGHEPGEAPVGPVVGGGLAVAIGIGLAIAVATWLEASWVGRPLALSPPPGLATPAPPPPPPEPRLEEVPGAQLRDLRAAEDRILNGTAWVDRQAGVARIPIDRAIDLLAEHPLPARPAAAADQAAAGAAGRPSDASSGRLPVRGGS
jgi:hypothetical protein